MPTPTAWTEIDRTGRFARTHAIRRRANVRKEHNRQGRERALGDRGNKKTRKARHRLVENAHHPTLAL
jgi:hypothetical protein